MVQIHHFHARTCTDFQVIWYDTSSCQFNGTAVSFYYTINHQYQPKQISLNHRMVVAQIPPIIINIPSLCPVKKNESKRISTFFNVTATFNYHPQPSFWLILSWTDCSIYPPESTRIIRYTSLSNITYHRLCGTAIDLIIWRQEIVIMLEYELHMSTILPPSDSTLCVVCPALKSCLMHASASPIKVWIVGQLLMW